MPQSVEVQTFGISEDYGTVTIRFDGSNSFGYLPSYINDRPAEIRIRMVRLGMENIRKKLGLPLTGAVYGAGDRGKSPLNHGASIPKVKVSALYVTDVSCVMQRHSNSLRETTRTTTSEELEFDDELDKLFKIQTNKSRYNVPRRLQTLIRDRCMATINEIARDHKKESNRLNVRKQKLESR